MNQQLEDLELDEDTGEIICHSYKCLEKHTCANHISALGDDSVNLGNTPRAGIIDGQIFCKMELTENVGPLILEDGILRASLQE